MRINAIELNNFRQFVKACIEFPKPKKHDTFDFAMIIGRNGSGKTTLLNAIRWCFFGEEARNTNPNEKELPIINNKLAEENKEYDVSVKIFFEFAGEEYYLIRSQTFKGKSPLGKDKEQFRLYKIEEGINFKPIDIDKVNDFIIKDIEGFFLFDGEKLSDFFNLKNKEIANSVSNIANLRILDSIYKHVEEYVIKPTKEKIRNLGIPEINELEQQINEIEQELHKIKQEHDHKNREIQRLEKELDELINMLERNKEIGELIHKKREYEENKKKLKENIDTLQERLFNLYLEILFYLSINKTSSYVINKIEQLEEKGQIPPAIDRNLLEKILKERECICGRKFEDGSVEYRKISEILRSLDYSAEESLELLNLRRSLDVKEKLKKAYELLDNIVKEMSEINQQINLYENKIKEINEILENYDERKIQELLESEKYLRNSIAFNKAELQHLNTQIENLNENLKNKRKKYNLELKKYEELKSYEQMLKIAEEISEKIKQIEKNSMERIRKEVETITNNKFKEMIWKKDTFSRIEITKDYYVNVYDKFNNSCFSSLSAGETQCLALAFILALSTVSEFEFPYIIDTPFGRISSEERERFAETLLKLSKKRQVIILSTDSEYDENVRKVMSISNDNKYQLVFNENLQSVDVVKLKDSP